MLHLHVWIVSITENATGGVRHCTRSQKNIIDAFHHDTNKTFGNQQVYISKIENVLITNVGPKMSRLFYITYIINR